MAVLERFINADCETCWRDKATPTQRKGELAIDWVLPGGKGDDAALAVAARPDALGRLQTLGHAAPLTSDALRTRLPAHGPRLRAAQGPGVNDYIGTSIRLEPARGGPWQAWLLLVETVPAGTEGSPVARNLVRNVFRPDWPATRARVLEETRSMQIHEGVQPPRLRLIALLHDARGRLVGAAQTRCPAP